MNTDKSVEFGINGYQCTLQLRPGLRTEESLITIRHRNKSSVTGRILLYLGTVWRRTFVTHILASIKYSFDRDYHPLTGVDLEIGFQAGDQPHGVVVLSAVNALLHVCGALDPAAKMSATHLDLHPDMSLPDILCELREHVRAFCYPGTNFQEPGPPLDR